MKQKIIAYLSLSQTPNTKSNSKKQFELHNVTQIGSCIEYCGTLFKINNVIHHTKTGEVTVYGSWAGEYAFM